MKIKAVIYQQKLLAEIPFQDYEAIKNLKAEHVCLPEYFFHPEIISYQESLSKMEEYSRDFNCTLIGGTTVLEENERRYNTCYIYHKSKQMGSYRKINLFYRELGKITPGDKFSTFSVNGINIGLMICADALSEGAWEQMSRLNPDIIYMPTFSPYKKETAQDKFKRDEEIYVRGAKTCNCPVVKTCCIGTFHDAKLQGRSLAATPEGILWRVMPEDENKKIIKLLEIEI